VTKIVKFIAQNCILSSNRYGILWNWLPCQANPYGEGAENR